MALSAGRRLGAYEIVAPLGAGRRVYGAVRGSIGPCDHDGGVLRRTSAVKPDRWQQVSQLYHAALAQDARERGRFLAQACGGDDALRREVESLLAHEGTAEGFLAAPALEMAAKVMAEDAGGSLTGRQIGTYQIQSALGAGGMGEVYRARDRKLNRDVAIKVLPEHVRARCGSARALQARSAGPRLAEPSQHRGHLRPRRIRRCARRSCWSWSRDRRSPIASRTGRFPSTRRCRSRSRSPRRSKRRTSTGSSIAT